ncbi:hypothetical protein SapgrDRAFT_3554, partial [Saprospira grandis DSM 2844]
LGVCYLRPVGRLKPLAARLSDLNPFVVYWVQTVGESRLEAN